MTMAPFTPIAHTIKTAVLVIDVQQGLCEREGQAFDTEGVIGRINRVTRKARNIGAVVVIVQHESASGTLQYQSPGWQSAKGLASEAGSGVLTPAQVIAHHNAVLSQIESFGPRVSLVSTADFELAPLR